MHLLQLAVDVRPGLPVGGVDDAQDFFQVHVDHRTAAARRARVVDRPAIPHDPTRHGALEHRRAGLGIVAAIEEPAAGMLTAIFDPGIGAHCERCCLAWFVGVGC